MRIRSLFLASWIVGIAAHGDEGMWTFDNVPLAKIQAKYGVSLTPTWLEHVRLSALGFPTGSGAFVSQDGLVVTNHHVARSAIEAAGKVRNQDYIHKGFMAATTGEEIPIPDLVLRTLVRTENVTTQVNAVVKPGMDEKQATEAKQKKLSDLRDDLAFKTKLRVGWQSFYHGGEHWLYVYRDFKDVRLVAAPEKQIAFFGGDPDNFCYPRHDLDFAMFRVYQYGEPYHPPHHLQWSRNGVKAGELTFVVGRPGETLRQETAAQMAFRRDVEFPADLAFRKASRDALHEFAQRSAQDASKVEGMLFTVENDLKANEGYLSGLADERHFAELEREESGLKAMVALDPHLKAEVGECWSRIEGALAQLRSTIPIFHQCNRRNSALLGLALEVVRTVNEASRPAKDRLGDYRDSDDLAWRKWRAKRPFEMDKPDVEAFLISRGLEDLDREMAPDDPLRALVLGGRKPAEVAQEAVAATKVDKAYFREDLVLSGDKAMTRSKDPLIRLALVLEARDRENLLKQEPLRETVKENWDRVVRTSYLLKSQERYPDADRSLRITFGPVVGLVDQGENVAPFTTFGDLYERARLKGGQAANGAWALPPRWIDGKDQVNSSTPLNFCHEVDIIGGNSGSPVIDVHGDCVGLIFDGNFQSQSGKFFYDGSGARAISVDVRAISEALIKLYGGGRLVAELLPN